MYLINSCGNLCRAVGNKLSHVFCRSQPETTPLREEQEREGGAYESMDISDVDNSRKSLSAGFLTFEESGAALKTCAILVTVYLIIGIVAYSYVFENWSVVASAYFSVVTFTTIGYGDLSPTTQAGRFFQTFFTLFGVTILGVFLGIIGSDIVESQVSAIENTKSKSRSRLMHMFSTGDHDNDTQTSGETEKGVESKEKSLWQEIREILWLEAPLAIAVFAVCIAIGVSQGWTVIDSIYFCTITLSTVGFGDMHPANEAIRLFFVFFLPVAVAVFGELLGRIASAYIDRKARKFEQSFLARELTLSDLEAMDRNTDNKVTRGEFLAFMLVAMQKVEQDSIDELNELFDSLDADGSGALDREDLVLLAKRRKERLENAHSPTTGTIV